MLNLVRRFMLSSYTLRTLRIRDKNRNPTMLPKFGVGKVISCGHCKTNKQHIEKVFFTPDHVV